MAENKISRVAALDATRDGAKAARGDEGADACPYDGSDLTSEFLRHHWFKGYRLASDA